MSLALDEILHLPGLGEMTVRAGARNLQRRVRWPYVAENEGIAEWVMGGELVFVIARQRAGHLELALDEPRLLQCIVDRSLITPGRKQPHMLVHTLDALLKENGNGLKASQRLGLHRNTINQRIQRIEQLSGQSLNDPLYRMNASVAMLVWRMNEAQGKE